MLTDEKYKISMEWKRVKTLQRLESWKWDNETEKNQSRNKEKKYFKKAELFQFDQKYLDINA